MSTYIIIPARKNSKRLRNKNLLKLNGLNLIDRTILFSKKIRFAKKIIITTDIKINNYYTDDKIIYIKRPKNLAKDKSTTISAVFNVIHKLKKKINFKKSTILLLQPTSPFRSLSLINYAFKKYMKNKKKYSIISVSKNLDKNNKKNFYIKQNKLYLNKKNKENLLKKKLYIPNGNFYFSTVDFLKKYNSFFFNGKTLAIKVYDKQLSIDIDTKKDYLIAKKYFKKK